MSIPDPLKDLLERLEFISILKPGDKPCFNDISIVRSNSWIGTIKRFIKSENRDMMALHIEKIVEVTCASIENYKGTVYHQTLTDSIHYAREGLVNLMETYKNCPKTTSRLKVCITNLNLQMKKK